jgi:hypothetical protein
MDSSGFGMEEVYGSDVRLRTNTNAEEPLQFVDFGSFIVQPATEVADLSMNYVEEGSVRSSDLSYDKSEADDSRHQVGDVQPEAEIEERLFTMDEVLRIVEFSQKEGGGASCFCETRTPGACSRHKYYQLEPNLTSPSPLLQSSTAAGGPIRKIQKKDYCNVTSDNFKLLRDTKLRIII